MGFDIDSHFTVFINYGAQGTEFNGFNTHFGSLSYQGLPPATHVTYLHLISMNSTDPETVFTTIHLVWTETIKADQ